MSKGQIGFDSTKELITEEYAVKRIRLTLDAFKAIREHVDLWSQRAMDLARHSVQRREDLANGYLPVQADQDRHPIRIKVCGPLATAVSRCRNELVSPFMVHRLPDKMRKHDAKLKRKKEHQCASH